jgi:glycosyltransferase involved in cell wall biosynthesis
MSEDPTLMRGGVAVVVRGDGAALAAVREHTPAGVPVLAISGDEAAARAVAPADLVLLDPGARVSTGWLDGLRAALGDDGTVATVSAVAVAGEPAAETLAPLRPRSETPAWGCVLVTRAALDLAGPLDAGFAGRCRAAGLLHVVAGEVVVGVAADPAATADEPEPVAWARRRAQLVAGGLSVTVDARILREPIAGTQVHTLELLAALHRTGALRLRALVPPDLTPTAGALLDRLDGLERLDSSTLDHTTPATAVVHRPYQVSGALDLLTLRQVGARLVVTHQDLLNFHQPGYHANAEAWQNHRRLTYAALAAAHRVVAFSEHAAADLRREDLVRSDRLRVVEIGVDHRLFTGAPEPRAPRALAALPAAPYLLCLGTDLSHKNRPFAIRLLQSLRERHGWPGRLVLAGTHSGAASSAEQEAALLAAQPELREAVVDVGAADEAEKAWLYANAAAAVYPTVYEGFGLVPFEAAEHGTPCLFAPQAALAGLLGSAALLVPWDPEASAARALTVLTPGEERERQVEAVRAAGRRLTWDRTAQRLLGVYEEALAVGRADEGWAALEAEARRGHWEGVYWKLFDDAGPSGLALVGPDGLLPEPSRRALAALAARPLTRRPLLAALGLLGRLGDRG